MSARRDDNDGKGNVANILADMIKDIAAGPNKVKLLTAAEVVHGVNLAGQNVLITGGNAGLGMETARAMALTKARIFITARDIKKAQSVVAELVKSTENKNIEALELDLSDLTSVEKAATAFKAKNIPLHILICNAGIMAGPLTKTKQGFESQFGTNHLGHAYLTLLLLSALLAAKKSRVVSVSSGGHVLSDVLFDDPNFVKTQYDPWKAYGQSKSANALFPMALNKRYGRDGLTAFSLHPGTIKTNLGKNMSNAEWEAFGFIKDGKFVEGLFKTVEQGAATSVYTAVQPDIKPGYFDNCAPADTAAWIKEDGADKLWALTLQLLQPYLSVADPVLWKQLA